MRQTPRPRRKRRPRSPIQMCRRLMNQWQKKHPSHNTRPSRKFKTTPTAWGDRWPTTHLLTNLFTHHVHHHFQDRLCPQPRRFPLSRRMRLVLQHEWTLMTSTSTRVAWSCPLHRRPSESRLEFLIYQIHLDPMQPTLQTLPIPSNPSHHRPLVRQCPRRTQLHSTILLVPVLTFRPRQLQPLDLPFPVLP